MGKMNMATSIVNPAQDFACWLGSNLDNATLAHEWIDRRTKAAWNCSSVFDAFLRYRWRFPSSPAHGITGGASFAESSVALQSLRILLQGAESDQQALHATTGVMLWGGVGPGNIRWLQRKVTDLLATLRTTSQALAAGDLDDQGLAACTLRFNAGMSKVYSLLVPGLIIYDSRVAAALGWAVVRYCEARQLTQLPEALAFPVALAKETPGAFHPKCRNPSRGAFQFPRLQPGLLHAAWNLKASWVLDAALKAAGSGSQFNDQTLNGGDPLRALEAALFMMGYDLPGRCAPPMAGQANSRKGAGGAGRIHVGAEVLCFTLGRGNEFSYRISAAGLHIQGQAPYDTQVLQCLVDALGNSFGTTAFPLGNARDRVADQTAEPGFGTTFAAETGRSSQCASRLAAALVDIGILKLTKPSPLLLTLSTSYEAVGPKQIDIAAILEQCSDNLLDL